VTSQDFAAGVNALLPVLTILAAGLVTIAVAMVTARATRKNEQAKIAAETDREKARLAHEKDLAEAAAERVVSAAQHVRADAEAAAIKVAAVEEAGRAKAVAELFFEVIRFIDSHDPPRDHEWFEAYFAERWPALEIDLRRAIGALKDENVRNRLIALVSVESDYEIASFHGSSAKGWAGWLADIGADLALTAARMEEPDAELLDRYKSFFESYTEVGMWREDRREADRGTRRDHLRDSTL
jgi:hypothetical protein